MKIILLRHGESMDDVLNCYGGAADYDLSPDGIATAKEVANKFKDEKIEKIFSSPLKRAYQTAEAINNVHNCGIEIADKLYERNSYGVLSGSNLDDCKNIFGWLLKDITGKIGNYYSDQLVVGAESVSGFDNRIKEAMQKIVVDAEGLKCIAIITHGNVTRSIYKNILKINGKVDLGLLAYSIIKYQNGVFTLISNDGIEVKD
jgi:broad specificity phosphatase PhoE